MPVPTAPLHLINSARVGWQLSDLEPDLERTVALGGPDGITGLALLQHEEIQMSPGPGPCNNKSSA